MFEIHKKFIELFLNLFAKLDGKLDHRLVQIQSRQHVVSRVVMFWKKRPTLLHLLQFSINIFHTCLKSSKPMICIYILEWYLFSIKFEFACFYSSSTVRNVHKRRYFPQMYMQNVCKDKAFYIDHFEEIMIWEKDRLLSHSEHSNHSYS